MNKRLLMLCALSFCSLQLLSFGANNETLYFKYVAQNDMEKLGCFFKENRHKAPGFHINAVDKSGHNALQLAIFNDEEEMMRFLIDKGASTSAKNKHGMSARDCAKKSGQKSKKLVKILNEEVKKRNMRSRRMAKERRAMLQADYKNKKRKRALMSQGMNLLVAACRRSEEYLSGISVKKT